MEQCNCPCHSIPTIRHVLNCCDEPYVPRPPVRWQPPPPLPPQPKLFETKPEIEHARARRTDPETSHEAAKSVNATHVEQKMLVVLRNYPDGLTSHQVADLSGIPFWTVSPRLKPMERKNLVYNTMGKRPNKSGRNGYIWKAI